MKKIYRWVAATAIIAASLYFVVYVVTNWQKIPQEFFETSMLPTLLTASLAYVLSFLIMAAAWRILLQEFGEKTSLKLTFAVLSTSQIAKYLPGNIGHHIGRVIVARKAGLASGPVILTMTLEASGIIFAAFGIACLALALDNSTQFGGLVDTSVFGKIIAVAIIAVALPFLIIWLVNHLPLERISGFFGTEGIRFPGMRSVLPCYFLYAANFFIYGAILYALVSILNDGTKEYFWFLTGVFSIAWLAGFVTPGAPSGLGVREFIMVTALEPIYGPGITLSLTIGLRVITTLGDGIAFLLGLGLWQELKTTFPKTRS